MVLKVLKQLYKFSASLKLAVLVVISIMGSLIVGTVLESLYDTATAKFWIYQTGWFKAILTALAINIFAVMVSRWPWKKHHAAFLFAHIGIMFLLGGAWVTDHYGLDGTLRVEEGETANLVELDAAQLVFAAENENLRVVPVRWTPPNAKFSPIEIAEYGIVADQFMPHADAQFLFPEAEAGDAQVSPWIQVRLSGGPMRIKQEFQLWAGDPGWNTIQAGPARLMIFRNAQEVPRDLQSALKGQPWVAFFPEKDGFAYQFASSTGTGARMGRMKWKKDQTSVDLPLGWKAGVKFEVLNWRPQASSQIQYHLAKVLYGQQAPPSAIHLRTQSVASAGQPGSDVWLGLGEKATLQHRGKKITLGYYPKRVSLPFSLKLHRFQIERYPGSMSPSEYSSQVSIADQKLPEMADRLTQISMNEPLKHQGITLYQASYEEAQPRPTVSVFSVNRDPGRSLKYWGSIFLVAGIIWLFSTRWRKRAQAGEKVMKTAKTATITAAIFLSSISSWAATAQTTEMLQPKKDWSFKQAALIPVQSGGRIKPLDTFARENILLLTTSRAYPGWDPVDLLFSWISQPAFWETQNIIRVSRQDVRRQLGLDESRSMFSPQELFQKSHLTQYAAGIGESQQVQDPKGQMRGQKTTPREEEMRHVLSRLLAFKNIVSGKGWLIVPATDAQSPWSSVIAEERNETRENALIRSQFRELVSAYELGEPVVFERAAILVKSSIEGSVAGWSEASQRHVWLEYAHNHLRLFLWAWILYLFAALMWLASSRWLFHRLAVWSTTVAFLCHVGGIALRCWIAGRPPVSNMYESIVWVSLGVMVFGMMIYSFQKQKAIMPVACALATLGLIAADAAPAMMDPGIHPLVPVLRSNYWLTVHVLTITLGYAAFALSLGVANVVLFQYLRSGPGLAARVSQLNQLVYRAMQFGVVLLAAGTILGGVWADYSWGRFWGWDPKETWALIALLGYVAILHARYVGWVGQFSYAAWSIMGFLFVVMAWYGVNFILGAGLHSYGFASGGQGWVFGACGLQVLYVGVISLIYDRRRKAVLRQNGVKTQPMGAGASSSDLGPNQAKSQS